MGKSIFRKFGKQIVSISKKVKDCVKSRSNATPTFYAIFLVQIFLVLGENANLE